MRHNWWIVILGGSLCAWGQVETLPSTGKEPGPTQAPPRSDRNKEAGESSSRDTRIDISPPKNDARDHPGSGDAESKPPDDAESDVQEFHPWDPHKAAKDVEIGDFYFRRKNYRAALDRYKEALLYKDNDAIATFRLAECERKSGQPADAITHYEAYLKILPHGPDAEQAQKNLEHLKAGAEKQTSSK